MGLYRQLSLGIQGQRAPWKSSGGYGAVSVPPGYWRSETELAARIFSRNRPQMAPSKFLKIQNGLGQFRLPIFHPEGTGLCERGMADLKKSFNENGEDTRSMYQRTNWHLMWKSQERKTPGIWTSLGERISADIGVHRANDHRADNSFHLSALEFR